MLDKAKAFPLLKAQQPESVADVDFTTYDGKPLVSDFNDYEIQIEEAFRFNAEDTLVFRLVITNKIDAPLIYQPDSFALRAGNRLYPQSISDADGTVPPKGQSIVYFAVTGTPDGGRNESVLAKCLHGFGDAPFTATAAARRHCHQCSQRASHPFTQRPAYETARLSQFFQNQERQARCLWRAVRRRADHFQRRSQTSSRPPMMRSAVAALATNATDKPQVVQTVMRPMQVFYPPPPKSQPTTSSSSSPVSFSETLSVAGGSREPSHQRSRPSACLPTVRREFRRPKS